MIHGLIEFLQTLTTPERLIQLLSTVMTGWPISRTSQTMNRMNVKTPITPQANCTRSSL